MKIVLTDTEVRNALIKAAGEKISHVVALNGDDHCFIIKDEHGIEFEYATVEFVISD